MTRAHKLASLLLGAWALAGATQALASQPLLIKADQSLIIALSKAPSTVVVGNPSIADVTLQGSQLFFQGKSFGTTNVIVLDDQGAQLGDYEVTVQMGGSYNVSLFKAGLQYSYACAPDCEAQMHVGDDPSFFKDFALDRNKEKINLATGQKAAETNQPAPAQ